MKEHTTQQSQLWSGGAELTPPDPRNHDTTETSHKKQGPKSLGLHPEIRLPETTSPPHHQDPRLNLGSEARLRGSRMSRMQVVGSHRLCLKAAAAVPAKLRRGFTPSTSLRKGKEK